MPSTSNARVPGQSLMELAVILPLLLVMLMAVADYALAFTAQTRLRNAVAEGGYVAAQNPGNAALVRDRIHSVVSDLNPPVTDADIAITSCVDTGANTFETVITLSYARPMLFGLFGAGPAITLTNSTTVPQFGGCR